MSITIIKIIANAVVPISHVNGDDDVFFFTVTQTEVIIILFGVPIYPPPASCTDHIRIPCQGLLTRDIKRSAPVPSSSLKTM